MLAKKLLVGLDFQDCLELLKACHDKMKDANFSDMGNFTRGIRKLSEATLQLEDCWKNGEGQK